MPYTRINPAAWPQDALVVPNGFGSMPPVEAGNRGGIGSEYFCLSTRFQIAANSPAHTVRRDTIATPQDGDFWCDQICAVSWLALPGGGVVRNTQGFVASMVTMKDIRTARHLVYSPSFNTFSNQGQLFPANSIPLNLLRKLPQSGTEDGADYDGTTPPPSGFRTTATLIQPYCFTRQGGIEVSLTTLYAMPAGTSADITIAFSGWKEYANASR